ncbi:DUF5706 domain-containing protein [Lachnospiraceae bacterium OttesenSCG-928-D06]|nr:DUF5706 domain-containing protein [Lachnospiraceae bacterium OttesenSCG-928-D06]
MEEKDINELLEKVFSNITSWLNFAETKNAANIALVVACIAALLSLDSMSQLLYVIFILLVFSGICSMISFIPRLGGVTSKISKLGKKTIKRKDEKDNLLFFEAIKNYSGQEYVERVSDIYLQINKKDFNRYQLDLSNEIVYNSNIASYKYKFFKVAAYLDVTAFVLLAISFIIA